MARFCTVQVVRTTWKRAKSHHPYSRTLKEVAQASAETVAFVQDDGCTVEVKDIKKRSSTTTCLKEGGVRVACISHSGRYVVITSRNHVYIFDVDLDINHTLGYPDKLTEMLKENRD